MQGGKSQEQMTWGLATCAVVPTFQGQVNPGSRLGEYELAGL